VAEIILSSGHAAAMTRGTFCAEQGLYIVKVGELGNKHRRPFLTFSHLAATRNKRAGDNEVQKMFHYAS
jgi:hypothetical protein